MQPNKLLHGLTRLHNAMRTSVQRDAFSNAGRLPQVCRMTTQNGAHGKLRQRTLRHCRTHCHFSWACGTACGFAVGVSGFSLQPQYTQQRAARRSMRSGGNWSAGSCTAPSSVASWSWTFWWAAHSVKIPLLDRVGLGQGPCDAAIHGLYGACNNPRRATWHVFSAAVSGGTVGAEAPAEHELASAPGVLGGAGCGQPGPFQVAHWTAACGCWHRAEPLLSGPSLAHRVLFRPANG
jgi:hypothetical protein